MRVSGTGMAGKTTGLFTLEKAAARNQQREIPDSLR
jgi:hypothetical protein